MSTSSNPTESVPMEETAEATTASSNNKDDAPSPVRKSGRKRKSTTILINGHIVKRDNNYVVNATSYEKGAYEGDAPKPKKLKPQAPKLKKAPTERKLSPSEAARLQHNDAVKASVKDKEGYRREFLVHHQDSLDPFMDEATRRMLQQWGSTKKKKGKPLKNEPLFVQPELITGGEMRDYQLAGLNFLVGLHRQNIGMILGDEMGLGKTLQTISFLSHLKEHDEHSGPSLIVCPLSVLYSWCAEFQKWAPSLKVLRLHSSNAEDQAEQRKEMIEGVHKYDAIVTTYDMVKIPQIANMCKRIHFRILVLDEGHKIKSRETLVSQAVRRIHCENRLLLTGTPLQNNLTELVNLLSFLLPDIFTNFEAFETAFDITNNVIDKEKMMEAQKVLAIFMLRRLKDQVEKLMPKKIETKVYCPLSNKQVFWYKSILMKDISALARQESQGEESSSASTQKLAGLFMQLRKACLHPFLFDGAEEDVALTTVDELIGASGKLAVLDSLLISLFQKGHRCVLFSQFTSVLDILADYCTLRGWKHLSFDGRTSRAKRNYYVNAFNAPKSPFFVFLMSTRSGSMGLNLQTADTCILFDSDFNPQMDLQAMARVHRIGQTKTVHVYRLVASGTVEERLIERAEKKLLLDQMVNRHGGATTEEEGASKMSAAELLKDIKFGSAAVFGDSSQNTLPTKEDIMHITDRKRSETENKGKLKGNNFHQGETFDASKELTDSQTFGGVDFRALREESLKKSQSNIPTSLKGIARLWNEISAIGDQKRKVKSRIIMVEGKGTGYGGAVPVLAGNNYDLQHGESSVFDRELSSGSKAKFAVAKKKKKPRVPANQEFCQLCGDGGYIFLCSRCPVSVHEHCCPLTEQSGGMAKCSHHECKICGKSAQYSGGLLYPCQSCPDAYCEDCLPTTNKGFRFLGACDRFEELGFESTKTAIYIHCSTKCEDRAKQAFDWKPPTNRKGVCPEEIDVSHNFGGKESERAPELPVEDKKPAADTGRSTRGATYTPIPSQTRTASPGQRAMCVPWDARFEQLQAYKEQHGHVDPRSRNSVPEADRKLAEWLAAQRSLFRKRKLHPERTQKLKEIGAFGFGASPIAAGAAASSPPVSEASSPPVSAASSPPVSEASPVAAASAPTAEASTPPVASASTEEMAALSDVPTAASTEGSTSASSESSVAAMEEVVVDLTGA